MPRQLRRLFKPRNWFRSASLHLHHHNNFNPWRGRRGDCQRDAPLRWKKQAEKAYATGYDKGKSDAVKQQYWLYVSMQRQRNQVSNVRLYPVQLPEQRIDGVMFQPSTKYLRIEE